ncbi:MAG: shikimate kinase, partial [Hyphomicrobiales bacterium]|nr:shikimate kinase [Hyphomicrobiales bacterium]
MSESELVRKLAGRSIILVGIMGSGKSSVGRRLAARLGLDFVDADAEIESAAGMTIPEIFSRHGEPYFRDGERRVIDRLLKDRQLILATGGGAFMNVQTRAKIANAGISVWLKADHDVLMRRVRKRANRPLLQAADPDQVMRDLMEERYPVYATADVTVISGDGPHEKVIESVIEGLEHFLTEETPATGTALAKVYVDIADRAYDVIIGRDLLAQAGSYISRLDPKAGCAIVTDRNVADRHLATLTGSLDAHGIRHSEFILAP